MRLGGNMRSLFLSDEELGKKDDDHKGTRLPTMRTQPNWAPARPSPKKSIKRLALALLVGLGLYLFIHNIPADLGQRDHRHPVYDHSEDFYPPSSRSRPPTQPPKQGGPNVEPKVESRPASAQTYNGPVKFVELGDTLRAISSTTHGSFMNKNVVFAASSLKSAAALLPIACQMGSELRNYVHFALMSRSEIGLEELRAVNGVDDSCHIIFHDARPDFVAISTDDRLALSVARALYHIHNYMKPQAVIVDASATEESYFLQALRAQAKTMDLSVINLPANSRKQLAYMPKLDGPSLGAWNKFHVDILIHAAPGASGSLMRLLKSLSAADYTSCSLPHLTIELPHDVDPSTQRFLEAFQWPPAHIDNPVGTRQLTIRRRIPRWSLKEEESSIRFLESFWPSNPADSHVLVLSPQVELSPQFFHWNLDLKYTVLEYKHSSAAQFQEWDARLLGISLDLPSTQLSGSGEFVAPTKRDIKPQTEQYPVDGPTPFLWQAPSSNAVLLLGSKWVELHGFVSRLFDAAHRFPASPAGFFSTKVVGKEYPSWLEQALRLARARGYWTLYPGETAVGRLAVVHTELTKAPEEYEDDDEIASSGGGGGRRGGERDLAAGSGSLLDGLIPAKDGLLPPFAQLPIVAWDGKLVGLEELDRSVQEYASEWRANVGGCEDLEPEDLLPKGSAADLFCEKEQ